MNIFSIILLVASFLNAYQAIICFRYWKAPGAVNFGLLLLTIVFYCFGYAFEVHSDSLPDILFWLKIEYIGIPFFPSFLLIFSIEFIWGKRFLKPWFVALLLTISFSTFLVHFTNSSTHWFYASAVLDTSGPFPLIQTTKGFWYWIHQGYSIVSMGAFNVLFIIMLRQKDKLKRNQALLMQLSSFAPWMCYLVYITGHSPHNIDPIPFSFVIMGFVMAWGMLKYKLFDLAPLALENVFEYMNDAVIITDQHDRISGYNKAASKVFNILSQRNNGLSFQTMKENYPGLSKIECSQNVSKSEFVLHEENVEKYFEVNVSEVYNKKGVLVGKTFIFRDITERKQSERLLISNQERLLSLNQTKDKLFSIISHDLRGSLGNIQSLSLILDGLIEKQTDEHLKRLGKALQASSAQSNKLLENLLLWAKSQSGSIQFTPQYIKLVNITKETIDVITPTAGAKQITIENNISDDITVNADPQMISLILRNLISNAIKFTHKGGSIYISAANIENEVLVRVEDTGIGIPEDIVEQLFSLNSRSKRHGTDREYGSGLGLILCKEFVDQHHGRIGVESTSDKGTVFFFTIPHSPHN